MDLIYVLRAINRFKLTITNYLYFYLFLCTLSDNSIIMQQHQNDVHNRHESDRHESVPFLSNFTGYIIGSQGRGIESLIKRSGVTKAWVDNQPHVHFKDTWSYLHVVGHPMNNDAAKCLLMQRIRDANLNTERGEREHRHDNHHRNDL